MSEHKPGAEALVHPVTLLALVTWIVNDHWAKAAHGGDVTGKLSDIAALIVFPLIPVAALELWRIWRGRPIPGRSWSNGWLVATGFTMVTINLFDTAAWIYRHGFAVMQWPFAAIGSLVRGDTLPALQPVVKTMDPTDLLTLPALLVPYLLVSRGRGRQGT